jgi:hypothetical protein
VTFAVIRTREGALLTRSHSQLTRLGMCFRFVCLQSVRFSQNYGLGLIADAFYIFCSGHCV